MENERNKPIFIEVKNLDVNDKDLEKKCLEEIRNLSEKQKFAVLATHEDGEPLASLVAFAASSDLKRIVFITPKNTTKYHNILMNGKVTLLIDNRSDQPESINQISALTVIGTAGVINTSLFRRKWQDTFLRKHPYLNDFAKSSSSAAIEVEVGTYIYVSKFQQVFEWHPEP